MQARLKKTVVLIGMMGAGKTAVGKALAGMLHAPFLDSDAEIEKAANMTIPEIFERDGEPFFRLKERQVISRLLEHEKGVLSTGGGAYMSAENREIISEYGVAIWLNADLDLLWNRVKHKDTRPLLRVLDPLGALTKLYKERVPVYAKADLAVVSEPGMSIDDMALRVIEALKTRPDVLEVQE